ncbi:MAG: hypothetical protein ACR2P0_05145 [Acidimicrobiales bacterium]
MFLRALSGEDRDAVAHFADQLRAESADLPPVVPSAALREFVGVGRIPAVTDDERRRFGAGAKVAAAVGAVGVKILIGGAMAAASVAGAHTSGVVDVPGLPDSWKIVGEVEGPVPDVGEPVEFDADEAEKDADKAEKDAQKDADKAERDAQRDADKSERDAVKSDREADREADKAGRDAEKAAREAANAEKESKQAVPPGKGGALPADEKSNAGKNSDSK